MSTRLSSGGSDVPLPPLKRPSLKPPLTHPLRIQPLPPLKRLPNLHYRHENDLHSPERLFPYTHSHQPTHQLTVVMKPEGDNDHWYLVVVEVERRTRHCGEGGGKEEHSRKSKRGTGDRAQKEEEE
ncbi:hypothetical protein Pmani_021687 [Petrolisthes manimaculis]|uniref:Uncharacterized protein n=1 Tax=Petrolisthes manimaculis TaxID=1843537 RepID=A0AAE1PFY0_9EUCA|nr:hypothetical protein Pmani_021687 [Petrolisthes manimaculis]